MRLACLVLAELAAGIVGLIGLAGLVSFLIYVNWIITVLNGRFPLFASGAVLMTAMTALFLVPSLRHRMIAWTYPAAGRVALVVCAVIWGVFSLAYLRQLGHADGAWADLVRASYGAVVWTALAAFALDIFPLGLGYTDHRAARRAAARTGGPG